MKLGTIRFRLAVSLLMVAAGVSKASRHSRGPKSVHGKEMILAPHEATTAANAYHGGSTRGVCAVGEAR